MMHGNSKKRVWTAAAGHMETQRDRDRGSDGAADGGGRQGDRQRHGKAGDSGGGRYL